MVPTLEEIKAYLAAQEVDFGYRDAHSVWEMLYWCYFEYNPADNDRFRRTLSELDDCMSKLSNRENDRVFDLFNDLSLGYEKAAFLAGLQTGLRLALEISPL